MLHIKKINGEVLYNLQPKYNSEDNSIVQNKPNLTTNLNTTKLPLPKLKIKKQSYDDWYEKNQKYVNYIVDRYLNALTQFQSTEYVVKFNYTDLMKDLTYWVYKSSMS